MFSWETETKRCKRGVDKGMKWMFFILFLTSSSYRAGIDIELFRFYTQEGCEEAKLRLGKLEKLRGADVRRRGGFIILTECFSEE